MSFRLVYSILLMGYFFSLHSQMLYTRQSSENSHFLMVQQEIGTGNYFVLNENIINFPALQIPKCQILKISPAGILLDSLNFSSDFYISGFLASGNFYYCYGTQLKTYGANSQSYFSTLYKIDVNLNIVKASIIDTSYNNQILCNRVIKKNSRLYIGNVHSWESQIYLYKTDLNLLKMDSTVAQGSILSDISGYGNRLLISGSGFSQGSPFGNNQVMEMDTSFNVLSRFNLDSLTYINPGCGQKVGIANAVSNLYEITPNQYAVTGYFPVVNSPTCDFKFQNITSVILNNSQVIKTNIIGNPFKDNEISAGPFSGSKRYKSIYTTSETGYNSLNPSPPQTNTTQILVHKVDTVGNLIWAKYYSDINMFYRPYGIDATTDSGVIVCGMRYNIVNPAVPSACEGFVMKLDKDGNQVFVGIKENGGFNINFHKCYPNPANDQLLFDLPFQEEIEIKIYDLLGKQMFVEHNYQNLSVVNISTLAEGSYIYKIKTKKNNYSGKFIKR